MTGAVHNEQDFIRRLTEVTEANLINENFGVSELAREMNMVRSTLHRKVRRIFNNSASQFINHIRLEKALEILQHNSTTISETAYDCGFHSVTYFSRCFHDYYKTTPGKARMKRKSLSTPPVSSKK